MIVLTVKEYYDLSSVIKNKLLKTADLIYAMLLSNESIKAAAESIGELEGLLQIAKKQNLIFYGIENFGILSTWIDNGNYPQRVLNIVSNFNSIIGYKEN